MQDYNSKFKILKNLKKELPGIQKNISLAKQTTFHIGGRARYFFEAKSKKDLIKAVSAAKKFKLPFFILGNGSNTLVADEGYRGLVIKIKNLKLKIKNSTIKTDAGVSLSRLINISVEKGLTGLEWAIGIPGTVGGAIYGNAGAFGYSMADVVKSVEVLEIPDFQFFHSDPVGILRDPRGTIFPLGSRWDPTGSQRDNFSTRIPLGSYGIPEGQFSNKFQIPNSKFQIKILKNRDCQFGYRDSIFKCNKNLIILSAELQLKKGKKNKIKEKMKEYLNYRKETQPLNFPSAGSVFKNQKSKIKNQKLLIEYPELKAFNRKSEISAGWLIEKCGLKGKRIGQAKISEKHANFIVNLGNAKAADVKKLINLAKRKVKNKFKIKLKEEIQYLGRL